MLATTPTLSPSSDYPFFSPRDDNAPASTCPTPLRTPPKRLFANDTTSTTLSSTMFDDDDVFSPAVAAVRSFKPPRQRPKGGRPSQRVMDASDFTSSSSPLKIDGSSNSISALSPHPPLRTPIKPTLHTPSRPPLSTMTTSRLFPQSQLRSNSKANPSSSHAVTPLKRTLTPLHTISSPSTRDGLSFERLAPNPLSTPRFRRNVEVGEETINKIDFGELGSLSDDEEREQEQRKSERSPWMSPLPEKGISVVVEESPEGHATKRRAISPEHELFGQTNQLTFSPVHRPRHSRAVSSSSSITSSPAQSHSSVHSRRLTRSPYSKPRHSQAHPPFKASNLYPPTPFKRPDPTPAKPPVRPSPLPLDRIKSISAASLFFGPKIEREPPVTVEAPPEPKRKPESPWLPRTSSPDLDSDSDDDERTRRSSLFGGDAEIHSKFGERERRRRRTVRDSGVGWCDASLEGLPRASTSVSTLGSSEDGLVTPGLESTDSGWPGDEDGVAESKGGMGVEGVAIPRTEEEREELILSILNRKKGKDGEVAVDDATPKARPPGTPVKARKTTSWLEKPWATAAAPNNKIALTDPSHPQPSPHPGLNFAAKGRLRQSMPLLSGGRRLSLLDDSDDEGQEGEEVKWEEELGLRTPGWLLGKMGGVGARANGSSSSPSGSEAGTPTRARGSGARGLPRIQTQFSPPSAPIGSQSNSVSTPNSGSSSATWTQSPLAYKLKPSRNSIASGVVPPPSSKRPQPFNCSPTDTHRPSLAPRTNVSASKPSATPFVFKVPQAPKPHRHHRDGYAFGPKLGRFERKFEEVEVLGEGEFGRVVKVKAKVKGKGDVWAVKQSKRFEGVRHRQRLMEEADVLKNLARHRHHPNVLKYIDSWEEDDMLYIQTEACEYGNFGRFLDEYGRVVPKLDEARVWKVFASLSSGLRFIHDHGIIHLDIKPANIFIAADGRLVIGDFGMATFWPRIKKAGLGVCAGSDDAETSSAGFEREGDKMYLAPEVLRGTYGMAADVFSFGMTMLETATNIVVPGDGEAWHALREEDFTQVDLEEDSPELFELIKSLMRKEPEVRADVRSVCAHPVVARARVAMERKGGGRGRWEGSPLACAPEGFLEEILGKGMDLSP